MLAAGQNANTDNANDGPIKHRDNPKRSPLLRGPTRGSAGSPGGHRPYRGRRNDRPQQNPSGGNRPLSNRRNADRPDQDVSRDHLNSVPTAPPNEQASVSNVHANSWRRGSGRGFRGNRRPPTQRDPPAASEFPAHNNVTGEPEQRYRSRGSRNYPRIPRQSIEVRDYQLEDRLGKDGTRALRQPCESSSQQGESGALSSSRGRPYRYSAGRGRNWNFGNRRIESSNTRAPSNDLQVDQAVIGTQGAHDSTSPADALKLGELPQKIFSPEEIDQLRAREIQQFKTRFPKSVPHTEDTYLFTFSPTDPDWVFDVRNIRLKVHFPTEYPSQALSIIVVNEDDVLPQLLVEDIDRAIVDWIKFFHKPGQLSFRPFLRWIDRNLQEIFVESLRKIKKLQERPTVELVDQENLKPCASAAAPDEECSGENQNLDGQPLTVWPMKALPKKQKRLEELDDLFDDAARPKPEVRKIPNHGPTATTQLSKIFNNYDPHTPPRRGIEVKFRHVDFSESVSFIVCDRLLVSVQCKKCKKIADFQLLPGRRSVSHCAKCQTKLEACFGPSILLQFNPLLGYLELKECTIRDVALSRCHFYADCLQCTKLSPLEGIHLGQRGSSHCLNCNVKMTFVMDSFKYMDLCAIEANIKASNLKKANKDSAIQAGKPLPSNGACKHYKKSFRWFRFPCCGKAYPCDDCHNAAEDHEAEFASRMICGFCAKEQPFSNDKPCSQCSNMITGRRTAHWEGGKGCRSQLKMNTNDSKKFAGMNKTVSRKSTVKTK